MPITSDWKITHDGVSYPAGTVVTVLSEEQERELIEDGKATRVPVVEVAAEGSLSSLGEKVEGGDVLTPEEFAVLTAAKQKEELESAGIEPGSNAETRVEQYTAYYDALPDEEDDNPEL